MRTSPADRYDAVIVGARCAGAATALLLARAGLRVLLVDRAAPGTDTLSTHALMRGGVVQLSKWGLLGAVVDAGTPPISRTLFDYGTHATTVTIRPAAGVDALYAPRRTVLDALLVDAAVSAGAHVAFDVVVTGLHRDDSGRVRGVSGHTRGGPAFHAYAPVTVGADGLRSTVADAVDAPVTQRGRHAGAVWCTYVTGLPNEGYRWFWRPGAAAGLIPTNDGATCVFAGMPSGRFAVPARGGRWRALLATLAEAAPDVAAELRSSSPVAPVRGWAGVPSVGRRAHGPGWALVGDAGYFKDPLSTHGMTQALRDAELLADSILAAHSGAEPSGAALARYERTRDRLSAGLLTATDALAAYDWDAAGVERLLRQLASAMSDEVEALAMTEASPGASAGRSARTA